MNVNEFQNRHNGPSPIDVQSMLKKVESSSLDELIESTVPKGIYFNKSLDLAAPASEQETLVSAKKMAEKNQVFKSYIGQGYYGTYTPTVILRNVLENPSWYTSYTPYQPEISQGRLEALINFQTMVTDLTGMEVSNASLLDEATAAAEAMNLAHTQTRRKKNTFFVEENTFPQTIELLQTRAEPLGIDLKIGPMSECPWSEIFGCYVQYPKANGSLEDLSGFSSLAKENGALLIAGTDLMALTLYKSPGEMGADIVVGSTQRFGVPMGFGGPHAAFLATKQKMARSIPGRIVGVSKDTHGNPVYRLTLQTREQHIRREKATSNICTAQVLLAVMAGFYGTYHGPQGLKEISTKIRNYNFSLKTALTNAGFDVLNTESFDTLNIQFKDAAQLNSLVQKAKEREVNFWQPTETSLQVSFDETMTFGDFEVLQSVFGLSALAYNEAPAIEGELRRTSPYLTHPVFNSYQSETEMLRYMQRLQRKDLSLADSMVALGSCTMKLNATTEMIPITWPEFANLHPFAPIEQVTGTLEMINELKGQLIEITGFDDVSLQPNAGSQGEYAGLLTVRAYHQGNNEGHRNICLIPSSAHGTNPASAVMAGMKVVIVACDEKGNVDVADLRAKAEEHKENLSALMITYPSTHGVFESSILEICETVHQFGGQVYMDGANMNALCGVARPGDFGVDVAHLNLHKTFCIPHGGGGPGVGPIGTAKHLSPYLPKHSITPEAGPKTGISAVSAAPWGSALILPISWSYIKMMGSEGLKRATQLAILNANYIADRLKPYYDILYTDSNGRVAHECIIDIRPLKSATGIDVNDVAKRMMDYGFHAPTMSWPVANTLMIEPTESENKAEIDRFCDTLIAIRKEVQNIEDGHWNKENNPLKMAPHTLQDMVSTWERSYDKETAFFPLPWVKDRKFIVSVNRVDNAYGDKNLMCSCLPVESYS